MFKYCINDTSRNLPIWWFLLTGVIYLVSCFPYKNIANDASLSEYIIICFSNSYYFLLILLPLLFIFLLRLRWTPPITVMIRIPSFSGYLRARFLTLFFCLAIIVAFHLVLTIVMGLGLSYSSSNALLDNEYNSLLILFLNHFGSTWLAISAILLNYLLGLYCLSLIIGTIVLVFPKRIATVSVVLMYFIILIGVQRSSIWNVIPFFIGNYIVLSNAISNNLFPWSTVALIAFCTLLMELMNRRWWKSAIW